EHHRADGGGDENCTDQLGIPLHDCSPQMSVCFLLLSAGRDAEWVVRSAAPHMEHFRATMVDCEGVFGVCWLRLANSTATLATSTRLCQR
ncbi:MAG TPA: hypothetical protein VGW38_18885, partial [Chloroflexota bacterium]|nr:hypothetical protein [Chloroflexota bacterium]